MNANKLVAVLNERLGTVLTNIIVTGERRVFGEVSAAKLVEVVKALKAEGMINIGTITGLDLRDQFEVIYHLYNEAGVVLNLKVFIPRENPRIPTVTDIFPGVFLYERELMDLLGIIVEGAPHGRRYPLPDNWPDGEYPLRKDWKGLPPENEVNDNGGN